MKSFAELRSASLMLAICPPSMQQIGLRAFELAQHFFFVPVTQEKRCASRYYTKQENDDGQNGVSRKSVLFRRFWHLCFPAAESRERKHYSLCLARRKVNCAKAHFGVSHYRFAKRSTHIVPSCLTNGAAS